MFERFSEPLRTALSRAVQETERRGGRLVETEHLLLGLLVDDQLAGALKATDIDAPQIQLELESRLPPAIPADAKRKDNIGFTDHAWKSFERAAEVAAAFGSSEINTGHLLFGILSPSRGATSELASSLQIDLAALTVAVMRVP